MKIQAVWTGYAELLKNWIVFSQKHLYVCPENPKMLCYGAGEHGHWGVHTHQKAFSAFAVAASLEEIDWSDTGLTREQVLEQAIGMLRYTLYTHLSMNEVCTDGEQWGHNWIYCLGLERMFHGIEAIEQHISREDMAVLKKVVLSECDYLLRDYTIVAGLTDDNKPESNIWNGAILYRGAALYPDAPNRSAYIEKARIFFANGISVPSDEFSEEVVDGQVIKDLFIGANMFENYACNHHRYMNVGYMVICLSNVAMLHFFLKGKNADADQMIYRHVKPLWELINTCTYDDGRLLRIGGDSRARYCYCQDYALPMWALIEDIFGEDCSEKEARWLDILQTETGVNGDGSFLSARFGHFEERSPVYYTRLESDRANVISMYLYWHKKFTLSCDGKSNKLSAWEDEYHGSALSASDNRYASFTWRAWEKPQGLLLPTDDSSLAEWRFNLGGRVEGVGRSNFDELEDYNVRSFPGGFVTCGSTISYSDNFMAEGQLRETMARKFVAFAALPDDSTVLCLQNATALNRTFVTKVRGIFWSVPNDIFNGSTRTLRSKDGTQYLRGGSYCTQYETMSVGKYANMDNKVGIAANKPLTLVRSGRRQVEMKDKAGSATLYAEELCTPYISHPRWFDRGETLIDVGFAMTLGNEDATKALCESLTSPQLPGLKAVSAVGKDGKRYVLVANLSAASCAFDPDALSLGETVDVATGKKAVAGVLKAGEATLLCV